MNLQKPNRDEPRRINRMSIALVVALTVVIVLVMLALLSPTVGNVYAPYIVNAL